MRIGDYPTVVLSGSSRYKEEYLEMAKELTFRGFIVLMNPVFSRYDNIELDEKEIINLKLMHIELMNIADKMFVINPDHYIGESTASEIAYFMTKRGASDIYYYTDFIDKKIFVGN